MIATQDVLHLLWEMEQKALHLWLPERHEPIPGYVLAWQGNPITDAQRNDRGFGVKRCWQIPENWGGRSQYQLG